MAKKTKTKLKMDFMSMQNVRGTSVDEKIKNILKNVKDGHIVVLDGALDADAEARLVTATMQNVKEDFPGIEFCSLPKKRNVLYKFIIKTTEILTGLSFARPGLTLVGPSTIIKEIKRNPDSFYVSAEV